MSKESTLAYVRNRENTMSKIGQALKIFTVLALINVAISIVHLDQTRGSSHGTCGTKGASILPVTALGCYLSEKK